jgi:hypothetical protein
VTEVSFLHIYFKVGVSTIAWAIPLRGRTAETAVQPTRCSGVGMRNPKSMEQRWALVWRFPSLHRFICSREHVLNANIHCEQSHVSLILVPHMYDNYFYCK